MFGAFFYANVASGAGAVASALVRKRNPAIEGDVQDSIA